MIWCASDAYNNTFTLGTDGFMNLYIYMLCLIASYVTCTWHLEIDWCT